MLMRPTSQALAQQMTLTPNDQAEALKTAIDGLGLDGETFILSVDKAGVVVD